jgi:plastocyanin
MPTGKMSTAVTTVDIGPGMTYSPDPVTVKVGATVRWTNRDTRSHTATSNPGTLDCDPASTETFDSGNLPKDGTFEYTFNNVGTFAYHCEIHGCDMRGSVQVIN